MRACARRPGSERSGGIRWKRRSELFGVFDRRDRVELTRELQHRAADLTEPRGGLRDSSAGRGPIDALEKALHTGVSPAYPELHRMMLTNVRAEVVDGRSRRCAPIRVRITGSSPNGGPWTRVGSSADILHASSLALTDSVEYALLVREREVARS